MVDLSVTNPFMDSNGKVKISVIRVSSDDDVLCEIRNGDGLMVHENGHCYRYDKSFNQG